MRKTLCKHGNSYALVIDKPILEMLNIEPETPLEITTDGYSLRIAPTDADAKAEKLAKARQAMHAQYAGTFRKLAE